MVLIRFSVSEVSISLLYQQSHHPCDCHFNSRRATKHLPPTIMIGSKPSLYKIANPRNYFKLKTLVLDPAEKNQRMFFDATISNRREPLLPLPLGLPLTTLCHSNPGRSARTSLQNQSPCAGSRLQSRPDSKWMLGPLSCASLNQRKGRPISSTLLETTRRSDHL